jgi:predicted metal-dependent hydrolase
MVPDAPLKPLLDEAAFRRGIQLFNSGEFFECHEVLEDLWRPTRGERRLFLQAVIHFAVALYHYEQNNLPGARRQLRKSLKKLAGYLPKFEGVDTRALYLLGLVLLARLEVGDTIDVRTAHIKCDSESL